MMSSPDQVIDDARRQRRVERACRLSDQQLPISVERAVLEVRHGVVERRRTVWMGRRKKVALGRCAAERLREITLAPIDVDLLTARSGDSEPAQNGSRNTVLVTARHSAPPLLC